MPTLEVCNNKSANYYDKRERDRRKMEGKERHSNKKRNAKVKQS